MLLIKQGVLTKKDFIYEMLHFVSINLIFFVGQETGNKERKGKQMLESREETPQAQAIEDKLAQLPRSAKEEVLRELNRLILDKSQSSG